jgi:hypothetical protein
MTERSRWSWDLLLRRPLAAEIVGFVPTDWVPPMKLRRLDRTGVYALAAARLALDDAKEVVSADGADDLGVVLGTWTAGGQSTQQFLEALFRGGPTGAPALLFDSTVGNSAASLAGLEFKLRGPNVTQPGFRPCRHRHGRPRAREGRALTGGVDAVYETFWRGTTASTRCRYDARERAPPFDHGGFAWRRRVHAVARRAAGEALRRDSASGVERAAGLNQRV